MIEDIEQHLRDHVVAEARTWIGTPWQHMGRNRSQVDCVGLIVLVGKECGLHDYPDDVRYTRESKGPEMLDHFRKWSTRINPRDAKPGDVLVFMDKLFPHHAGIVAEDPNGKPTVIHSTVYSGKVMEHPLWWVAKDHPVMAAFRFNFLVGGDA